MAVMAARLRLCGGSLCGGSLCGGSPAARRRLRLGGSLLAALAWPDSCSTVHNGDAGDAGDCGDCTRRCGRGWQQQQQWGGSNGGGGGGDRCGGGGSDSGGGGGEGRGEGNWRQRWLDHRRRSDDHPLPFRTLILYVCIFDGSPEGRSRRKRSLQLRHASAARPNAAGVACCGRNGRGRAAGVRCPSEGRLPRGHSQPPARRPIPSMVLTPVPVRRRRSHVPRTRTLQEWPGRRWAFLRGGVQLRLFLQQRVHVRSHAPRGIRFGDCRRTHFVVRKVNRRWLSVRAEGATFSHFFSRENTKCGIKNADAAFHTFLLFEANTCWPRG